MTFDDSQIYYLHDPMCSWCWGFKPTWDIVTKQLNGKIKVVSLLGGLAPDSDEDMPLHTRDYVLSNWRRIEKKSQEQSSIMTFGLNANQDVQLILPVEP